jgi:Icc-related predicted phosphoesterase
MIRLAAVADLHAGPDARDAMASHFANLSDEADLLLIAGDLTRSGLPEEAEALASLLAETGVPVVAVLGNVDYDAERAADVAAIMRASGVHMLDRSSVVLDVNGEKVAIAGVKGFGGGFGDALAEVSGEPEKQAWVRYAEDEADALEGVLASMVGDIRLALLHYAPITDTITGERLERYAFAGNSMLGAAIDRAGADLVLHGHIHRGSPAGRTPGGVPVRNVALQVIREPYAHFIIEHAHERPQRERRRWRREQREQRLAARLPWRRQRQRDAETAVNDATGKPE